MGFASKIQIGERKHSIGASLYGECNNLANEPAKAVDMDDFDALIPGTTIHVKFKYSNTAANPTLNVNGTNAIPIYRHGVTAPGASKISAWAAGAVISFTLTGDELAGYGWTMEEPFDLTQMVNFVYPVGSIYMSVNSTSPATLFGGTWERITGKFLLSATDGGSSGASQAAGTTGGTATTTLATTNLPSHTHQVGAHAHGLNSHTHSVGAHAHGLNSHTHTGPSHSHTVNSHTHSIPALSGSAASNGAHTHKSAEKDKWFPILKYILGRSGSQACSVSFTGSNKMFGSSGDWDDVGLQESTGSAGAHTHSVSTSASTSGSATPGTSAAGTGNTGGPSVANTANSAAFNSGGPSTTNTANSTAFNSGATGSGTAFSNMPPFLSVYVWKRTA